MVKEDWKLSVIAVIMIIIPIIGLSYLDSIAESTPALSENGIMPYATYKAYNLDNSGYTTPSLELNYYELNYEPYDILGAYSIYDTYDMENKTISMYFDSIFDMADMYCFGFYLPFGGDVDSYTFNIEYWTNNNEVDDIIIVEYYNPFILVDYLNTYDGQGYDLFNKEIITGDGNITYVFSNTQVFYEMYSQYYSNPDYMWIVFKIIVDGDIDLPEIRDYYVNVTIGNTQYIEERPLFYQYYVLGTGIFYCILGLFMSPLIDLKDLKKYKWW